MMLMTHARTALMMKIMMKMMMKMVMKREVWRSKEAVKVTTQKREMCLIAT